MTLPKADNKASYMNAWKRFTQNMLGWSDGQLTQWVKKWEPFIDSGDGLFYHETPLYYVIPLLLPPNTLTKLGRPRYSRLFECLEWAIRGEGADYESDADYDWAAA